MTTIAYRDGAIAADTSTCAGGSMVGRVVKIARNATGDLAGAAGDAWYCRAFLAWFEGGEKGSVPEGKSEHDGFDRGCIFRRDGSIEVYEPRGMFTMTAPYYALGSGKAEALGAMFAGADAEIAVRAAVEHDPHTGGDVVVLRADGKD